MMRWVLAVGFIAATLGAPLVNTPIASADCVNAGNATVCAQGTVSGGGPTPPSAGPYTPYPCDLDYLCDAGLSIELGPPDWDGGWRPGGGIGPRR
jgi:hypothetical protein